MLYIHLFKILTIAIYTTHLAFGAEYLQYIHFGGLLIMFILALTSNTKAFYKINWIYCVIAVSLASLWQGYLYSFLTLSFVRLYYMFI